MLAGCPHCPDSPQLGLTLDEFAATWLTDSPGWVLRLSRLWVLLWVLRTRFVLQGSQAVVGELLAGGQLL